MARSKLVEMADAVALVPDGARLGLGGVLLRRKPMAFVAALARFDAAAPAVFPVVDQLTKPLRAAAASRGDLDLVNLWAGTQWRSTRTGPAADILRSLIAAD